VVRDYLLHGPIKVQGKTFKRVYLYYYEVCKHMQRGHWFNVPTSNIQDMIKSPTLIFDGYLLNNPCAVVCDIVHWAMTDYARKRPKWQANIACQVRSLLMLVTYLSSR
jgi:hypothetical protein